LRNEENLARVAMSTRNKTGTYTALNRNIGAL